MPDHHKRWTVIELIHWSSGYLRDKGIESARLNVERMLCHIFDYERVKLYLDYDRPVSEAELKDFKKLLLRRASGEPLQYILGESEFFSLRFKVCPGVLIPRPETEILVQHTISRLKNSQSVLKIVDVGTGSGIIAITLTKYIPSAFVFAIDISKKALQTAAENAEYHEMANRIDFIQCDILHEENWRVLGDSEFDAIVSNPPYIATNEAASLQPEVREFEPREALFVDDPLRFYRALLRLAKARLKPGGMLACEIAANRYRSVQSIFVEAGLAGIDIERDLAGRARVISGRQIQKSL
jgi:release factor glutamine methyltransferase